MVSLTEQEWVLIFSVIVALIVFLAAVLCIVYALICALRQEDDEEEARSRSEIRTVKRAPSPKLCRHHSQQRKEGALAPATSFSRTGYVTIEIFKELPDSFDFDTKSSTDSVFE